MILGEGAAELIITLPKLTRGVQMILAAERPGETRVMLVGAVKRIGRGGCRHRLAPSISWRSQLVESNI